MLADPTPIRGTTYVAATMRLVGVTAAVFREQLQLKVWRHDMFTHIVLVPAAQLGVHPFCVTCPRVPQIVGAFAEVLSQRVPSLADEDVDVVGIFNLGTGSAVAGIGSEAVRQTARSTTARMNSKNA